MRILFALNSATGGATVSALELMVRLRRRGHHVFVVVSPGFSEVDLAPLRCDSDGLAQVFLPWWNRNYRAKLLKRPLLWGWDFARSAGHVGSLAALVGHIRRWKIDVVHSNTSLTLEPALAALITRRPHLWHIREEIGHEALFRFWPPEPVLARIFDRLATALVANSETSRAFFVRHGLATRVRVIYNGVDVDAMAKGYERGLALRRRWGVRDDVVLVGMVGALTSRMKRHELFVRMSGRVDTSVKTRFVVIGTDPLQVGGSRSEVAYATTVRRAAEASGIPGRILWAGHESDVPAIMHALDILVHPSERESFGRVAIEAMAAAKPVVAAASGGLAEIVQDERTGLLVAGDEPEPYARAVERLVANRALAARLGKAGQQRATARFALDETVRSVESVYRKIATTEVRAA